MGVHGGGCISKTGNSWQCGYLTLEAPASLQWPQLLTIFFGGGPPEVGWHPLDPPEEGDDEDLVLGRRPQVGQRVRAGHTPGDGDNIKGAVGGRGEGQFNR